MKAKYLIGILALAGSAIAITPGVSSGEFDLTSLNAQVQNHEQRITTLETNSGVTPSPVPEASTNQAAAAKVATPGSPSAQSPQTGAVTVAGITGSAEAPEASPTPIPKPDSNIGQYGTDQNGNVSHNVVIAP